MICESLEFIAQTKQALPSAGLFIANRHALHRHAFPHVSRERREAAKRVRMDRGDAETWSDARKAAEALFDKPEQD